MSLSGVVLAGRKAAERLMVDTCVVVDLGAPVTAEDGSVVRPGTVAYSGRCKVQTYEPHERAPEVGGAEVPVQRYSVHVPVGSFRPAVGQVVEVTSARLDPFMSGSYLPVDLPVDLAPGTQFRVMGLLHKTAATAYRLLVDEYVGETVVWSEESPSESSS